MPAHKWGDRPSLRLSPMSNVDEQAPSAKLPISLQVGEMSGRTEGGAKDRYGALLSWSAVFLG
ncbi:MAG: hypothetical protein EOS04_06120 [Mesorhizobium sp.]|nr:MAG: hypothetical protein EOR98_11290 [Mesorhizobium sp.]RWN76797.1 MAG: hypothetical protein EOS02_14980 [Mesorhizobium sp.]RWN81589.1 MAG: hypothetical protein EOS01_09580 [Mesorhizobium sp.]RWN90585.1 MAG: hypothetical protein EOS04_06120 [Mesorhizobium sp.]RWO15589.1 MAG: hypothetical protein EOS15_09595 [Mesorhizobium sp.]